jgi:NTP pyrophosphatase (non-canonical NTP hydrolase)
MEFKEIQKKVITTSDDYGKKYDFKVDADFALLKLYEEVGELTQSILIQRKKCRPEKYLSNEEAKKEIAKELADVAGTVMVISSLMDIDLEDAINKKWITKEWIKSEKNNT